MVLYGLFADKEGIGNLFVEVALRYVGEDFGLSGSQGGDERFNSPSPGEVLELLQYFVSHLGLGEKSVIYRMFTSGSPADCRHQHI